jgi:hypothetical protein
LRARLAAVDTRLAAVPNAVLAGGSHTQVRRGVAVHANAVGRYQACVGVRTRWAPCGASAVGSGLPHVEHAVAAAGWDSADAGDAGAQRAVQAACARAGKRTPAVRARRHVTDSGLRKADKHGEQPRARKRLLVLVPAGARPATVRAALVPIPNAVVASSFGTLPCCVVADTAGTVGG